jgi:hypothetical protein
VIGLERGGPIETAASRAARHPEATPAMHATMGSLTNALDSKVNVS